MFDVGFWELTIVAVVALLVVGPERLPVLARTAGKWLNRMRRMARELRYELEREVDLRGDLQNFGAQAAEDVRDDAVKDVDKVLGESIDVDSTKRS